jgi:hypothetical protein
MAVQTISNTYSSNVDISIPANARNITLTIAGARGGDGGLDGGPEGLGDLIDDLYAAITAGGNGP